MKEIYAMLGAGVLASLVVIVLAALVIGIQAGIIYMIWNFVCDSFVIAYWISYKQAIAVTLVLDIIKGLFNKADKKE